MECGPPHLNDLGERRGISWQANQQANQAPLPVRTEPGTMVDEHRIKLRLNKRPQVGIQIGPWTYADACSRS